MIDNPLIGIDCRHQAPDHVRGQKPSLSAEHQLHFNARTWAKRARPFDERA